MVEAPSKELLVNKIRDMVVSGLLSNNNKKVTMKCTMVALLSMMMSGLEQML